MRCLQRMGRHLRLSERRLKRFTMVMPACRRQAFLSSSPYSEMIQGNGPASRTWDHVAQTHPIQLCPCPSHPVISQRSCQSKREPADVDVAPREVAKRDMRLTPKAALCLPLLLRTAHTWPANEEDGGCVRWSRYWGCKQLSMRAEEGN